jgi:exopolyphosphatase / guanosine-5'-triphosphate,3'-diphosphate pyrophosphatase
MQVAVIDVGSNSTRLLLAEVDEAGGVVELDRRTTVTRLGQGVDAAGHLAPDAIDRVIEVVAGYRTRIEDGGGADAGICVLTSAARDAADGPAFAEQVGREAGIPARILTGDEEANLSFLGATSARVAGAPEPVAVIDVGGGSTEVVIGRRGAVDFHVSTQAGVVRQAERHLHHDPPEPDELQALTHDVRAVFEAAIPPDVRQGVAAAIGVAGTATSLAAIDQELEPYDSARVHGYRLARASCEEIMARLAQMTTLERRSVPGLHPDRAPTIVPGCALLIEALRILGLDEVEVSEHDILRGAALHVAGVR